LRREIIMKKRIVSILLIATMVLGTFSISVFAADELAAQDNGQTEAVVPETPEGEGDTTTEPTGEEGKDGEETPAVDGETPAVDGEAVATDEDAAVETQGTPSTDLEPAVKLATPTGLVTYSAYQSVALEWDPVPNAGYYEVYMDGVCVNGKYPTTIRAYDNANRMYCLFGGLGDEGTHYFAVKAMSSDTTKFLPSEVSATVSDSPVRQMYIWFKFKKKSKLKSHDGMKVKHTFNKNEWVRAHGFGGGKYKFYYNGNLFYSSYLRTKGAWCDYQKGSSYDVKEAEYFVNTSGTGSATPWYLWVNQNTQHVYLLYGSAGNYRVYDHWICSTGAAKTPSPTGFNKKIYKRVKKRNGHGPWTAFQSWTSFHGSRKSWAKKWGNPASHACIRCPNEKAQFIYKNIPNGTCVSVF
jgi:hypothetical protein